MKVRSGFNSEPYGRYKFDIELGEEDLGRILAGRGIDPARAAGMLSREAYKVLYAEAEMLARAAMIRHIEAEMPAGDAAARRVADGRIEVLQGEISALKAERNVILDAMPRQRAAGSRAKAAASA